MDMDSPGRSGSRFLTSFDKLFVVKTIFSEEVAEMHRILKDYHQVQRGSFFMHPLLTQQYIQDREFQWNDVISSDPFTSESLERNSYGKLDLEIMVQIQNNESYWLLCFTVFCST